MKNKMTTLNEESSDQDDEITFEEFIHRKRNGSQFKTANNEQDNSKKIQLENVIKAKD